MNANDRLAVLGAEAIRVSHHTRDAKTTADVDWWGGQVSGVSFAIAMLLRGTRPTALDVSFVASYFRDSIDEGWLRLPAYEVTKLRHTYRDQARAWRKAG